MTKMWPHFGAWVTWYACLNFSEILNSIQVVINADPYKSCKKEFEISHAFFQQSSLTESASPQHSCHPRLLNLNN